MKNISPIRQYVYYNILIITITLLVAFMIVYTRIDPVDKICEMKVDSVEVVKYSDFVESYYYVGDYNIYIGEMGIKPLNMEPGYEVRLNKKNDKIIINKEETDKLIKFLKNKKNYKTFEVK